MKEELVYCTSCNKEITNATDINILWNYFSLSTETFCNDCYARRNKEFKHNFIFGRGTPINSQANLYGLVGYTIIGVMFILTAFLANFEEVEFWTWILITVLYHSVVFQRWHLYFQVKKFIDNLVRKTQL